MIDVREGFLFVADGELVKVFIKVDIVFKDVEGVAELVLEFVCVLVIVVDDVPLLDLVVDNVVVLESFKIVFVLKGLPLEVFELLEDLEFVGVKLEVLEEVIVLVPEDEPEEDFECILLVFVGEFVCDAEDRVDLVIDTDPLDVFDVLIDLVFVTDEDDEAVAEDDLE